MKGTKISVYTFVITIIFMTFFFLSIFGMQGLFPNIQQEKQADFGMDLMKIVFSSLLSAGVAYYVSIIQVKSATNREIEKEISINISRVRLLRIEIKDNRDVLSSLNRNHFPSNSNQILESQISRKVLNMYFDKLVLREGILEKIIKYDKKLSLFVTAKPQDMENTFQNLLNEIDDLIEILNQEITEDLTK